MTRSNYPQLPEFASEAELTARSRAGASAHRADDEREPAASAAAGTTCWRAVTRPRWCYAPLFGHGRSCSIWEIRLWLICSSAQGRSGLDAFASSGNGAASRAGRSARGRRDNGWSNPGGRTLSEASPFGPGAGARPRGRLPIRTERARLLAGMARYVRGSSHAYVVLAVRPLLAAVSVISGVDVEASGRWGLPTAERGRGSRLTRGQLYFQHCALAAVAPRGGRRDGPAERDHEPDGLLVRYQHALMGAGAESRSSTGSFVLERHAGADSLLLDDLTERGLGPPLYRYLGYQVHARRRD